MERKVKEVCNIPDEILTLLQKDIAEIKVALLGNEYNPSGGLLYRVAALEKVCEQLKTKYERVLYTATGVTIVIAVIANLIMWVFDVWKNLPIK